MERQPSARAPAALSPQDLEALLEDFSSSAVAAPFRRARWLQLPLLDLTLASFLRRDFPSHLKPLLLSFLDDHLLSLPLPSSPLPPLLAALHAAASNNHPFYEHLLVTATSLFASHLAAPVAAPDAPPLAGLVELLLAAANRPNHAPDRAARALACDALRALEDALPGVLADAAGYVFALAAAERSSAAQSYLLLLAAVARHLLLLGRLASSASILALSGPLTPFSVPAHLLTPPPVPDAGRHLAPPSELNVREIRKVIALLMERPQVLTPAAGLEMAAMLAEMAAAVVEWAPAIAAHVKVQFGGMIHSSDPLLLHVVLTLFMRFPDAFGADDERRVARRLALVAREAHQPLNVRLLALHWLLGWPRFRDPVSGIAGLFYPSVFDPLALKAKKLDCLALVVAGIDGKKEVGGGGGEAVGLIEDGLVCLSALRWLPPWSTETGVAFRALHGLLLAVSPHTTNDSDCSGASVLLNSTVFNNLQNMFVDMASEHRGLVPVIADFIDRLLACDAHRRAGERLLRTLDECLLPKLEPGYQLASYYPLFERIAHNETVPPLRLIELLTKQMISLAKKHGPDTELRSWSQGSKVVGICRAMLKHHHSSRVFRHLSHLLVLTTESFPDLEVRDHARMCLRMLSCIPGTKLRHLIRIGEQPSGVTSSPHPGSLFGIPSPRPAQGHKSSLDFASYIHLERVVPLVVKQSWSLTVPNFSIQSKASSSILSIQDVSSTPVEPERPAYTSVERIAYTQEQLRVMDSKGAEILQILRTHFRCILDYLHTSGIKIRIPCVFRFESEPFNRAWGSDSPASSFEEADELPALYATTITFSSTAKFGGIPPCRVPFLLGEPSESGLEMVPLQNGHQEESRYRASVVIELEPQEPMPGLIDVVITTNTGNCQVINGPLQSVTVGIEDMFLKASLPPDIPEDGIAKYYLDLFHALWEACDNSSNIGRETFPLSGGKGSAAINGTRSVKLLEVTPKVLIKAVERYLAPFVVSISGDSLVTVVRGNGVIKDIVWEKSDSDVAVGADALVLYAPNATLQLIEDEPDRPRVSKRNMGVFHVLIFLPPRYHLLFLMEVGYASTLVRIRTDHWPCLAYVDEYLEAFL